MWVQSGDDLPRLFRRVGEGWQDTALPTERATRIAFSPDGRFVAMVRPDLNQVVLGRLWPDHIQPLHHQLAHTRQAIAATFLPDSKSVLTVGHDRCLRWWDVESGKSLGIVGRHDREIHDVAVSADGKIAVTVADDRWLAVWDIPGRKLRTCFRTEGAMVRVSMDADAEIIVSGDEAGRPIILRRISRA
jgi:WD40 repeat protein